MENCVIQTRVPARLKQSADKVFSRLGITVNDGIRMFLSQVTIDGAMPFRPSTNPEPNEKTKKAMQNVKDYLAGKNTSDFKSFDSVGSFMADLMAADD